MGFIRSAIRAAIYPRRTSMSRITIPQTDKTPSASLPLLEAVSKGLPVNPAWF